MGVGRGGRAGRSVARVVVLPCVRGGGVLAVVREGRAGGHGPPHLVPQVGSTRALHVLPTVIDYIIFIGWTIFHILLLTIFNVLLLTIFYVLV